MQNNTLIVTAVGTSSIQVGDIITIADSDALLADADYYNDEFTARAIRRQRNARKLKAAQFYAAEVRARKRMVVLRGYGSDA